MKTCGFEVTLLEGKPSTKWISADGVAHTGPTLIFEAHDEELWMQFLVQADEDTLSAAVRMAICKPSSDSLMRVMHKTDVYVSSDKVKGKVYHPLGIAFIDGEGRLRRHRLEAGADFPKEPIDRILTELKGCEVELAKYQEVTSKRNPPLANKLCVAMDHDSYQKMVCVFICEKVMPILGSAQKGSESTDGKVD